MTDTQPKKSDLGVRVASAVVMVAVAGTALWLGGWVWLVFVALVALGVLWEWRELVQRFASSQVQRIAWLSGGTFYIGFAAFILYGLRTEPSGFELVLGLVGVVIAIDVGAYVFGRMIGGPKIAPRISPSKTWAGLMGGAFVTVSILLGQGYFSYRKAMADQQFGFTYDPEFRWPQLVALGLLAAVVAQAGDFFQSWMKRRAGVKDSSNIIPGHGGLFDRVDGLLAVAFSYGLFALLIHDP